MSFDLNKLWGFTFGTNPQPQQQQPAPKASLKAATPTAASASPLPSEAAITEYEDLSGTESGTGTGDTSKRSDVSKDFSSDDTVMDVNSEVLEVSHSSVLARPHPPPFRDRHGRIKVLAVVDAKVAPAVSADYPAAVVTESDQRANDSERATKIKKSAESIKLTARSVKATKAIRAKPKKLPWYKRVAAAVKRKSSSSDKKTPSSKNESTTKKGTKTKKAAAVGDGKSNQKKRRTWKEKARDKIKKIKNPFVERRSTKTVVYRKKATTKAADDTTTQPRKSSTDKVTNSKL